MHKFLATGLVAALVAVSAQGRVICSGDSAPVAIDSRVGLEPLVNSVELPWDASWVGGDTNAMVVIGTNVFESCSALETVVTNGLTLYQGWCLGFAEETTGGTSVVPVGSGHAGRVTLPY